MSTSFSSAEYTDVEPLQNTQKPCVSVSQMALAPSGDQCYGDYSSEHSAEEQTQGQMLDDDLMRIIGDCQEKEVESFELSKINENSKNSFDKSRSSLNKSGESLDSLIQNFQQMEIKTLKEAPAQPEYKSIFASDPVWTPQA